MLLTVLSCFLLHASNPNIHVSPTNPKADPNSGHTKSWTVRDLDQAKYTEVKAKSASDAVEKAKGQQPTGKLRFG